MRYLVLILVAGLAVWYFFFRDQASSPAPYAPPPAATPEQQFQSLLSGADVDAGQLASLCSAYPRLAPTFLAGKQFRIKGTIAQVRTSGLDNRRAEVVLAGGGPRRLVLVCDLDQYSQPSINFRYLGKFEALGTELLYLVRHENTYTKKVVTTQGSQVSQFSSLKTLGQSWIEFQMVDGPQWAKAETNK